MYGRGMTTRQISEQIEDIYGFDVSESLDFIYPITASSEQCYFRNYYIQLDKLVVICVFS